MAYQAWVGNIPKHPPELKCIIDISEKLEKSDKLFFLFINFDVSYQIDLAVLKEDGIFIIELKNWGNWGRIRARQNGYWEGIQENGEFFKIEKENPYHQIQRQYYSFLDYLKENKEQFLSKQKASQIGFKDIKSVIAIAPRLERANGFEKHPKIKVIGFDELYSFIYKEESKGIHLSEEEINKLIELLNLLNWPEISRLLSPMKSPFDFDWNLYFNSLIEEEEYKELYNLYIPQKINFEKHEKRSWIVESTDLRYLINEKDKLQIIGEAGSGKTSVLKLLAYECAKNNLEGKENFFPVFIPLNLYDHENGGLKGLINSAFHKYGLDTTITELDNILWRKKDFIFLFDGLNEIPEAERNHATRELNRFIMDHYNSRYIFTSRIGFEHKFGDAEIVYIKKFTKENIFDYLNKFFKFKQIEEKKVEEILKNIDTRLINFAQIPLVSFILAEVLTEYGRIPPITKSSLFQIFIQYILKREEEKGDFFNIPSADENELFLSNIAYRMMEGMIYSVQENRFKSWIKEIWSILRKENKISCTESEVLSSLLKSVFLRREKGNISFWHPQFQEYLASIRLSDLLTKEKGPILNKLLDLRWNEVLVFTLDTLALDTLDNVENILELATESENYYLIGKCLAGDAGEKTQDISR